MKERWMYRSRTLGLVTMASTRSSSRMVSHSGIMQERVVVTPVLI